MLYPLFAPAFAGAFLLFLLIRRFIIETPSDMCTLMPEVLPCPMPGLMPQAERYIGRSYALNHQYFCDMVKQ